jgi:vacuolar-type H+-ATPase subunit F/Vma7
MTAGAPTAATSPATNGVAVIGAPSRVAGFALAGAQIYPAEDDGRAVAAWRSLPDTVAVIIFTEAAAAAVEAAGADLGAVTSPLTVVLPR